jgi:hypothetical protein
MKEGASHAGGNGDQFPLPVEHLHLPGAGELWKIDGAAAADARSGLIIGGHGRKLWQQLPWMDE